LFLQNPLITFNAKCFFDFSRSRSFRAREDVDETPGPREARDAASTRVEHERGFYPRRRLVLGLRPRAARERFPSNARVVRRVHAVAKSTRSRRGVHATRNAIAFARIRVRKK